MQRYETNKIYNTCVSENHFGGLGVLVGLLVGFAVGVGVSVSVAVVRHIKYQPIKTICDAKAWTSESVVFVRVRYAYMRHRHKNARKGEEDKADLTHASQLLFFKLWHVFPAGKRKKKAPVVVEEVPVVVEVPVVGASVVGDTVVGASVVASGQDSGLSAQNRRAETREM